MILTDYSGAQGTLIHEKKLRSKIACQTPFKLRKSWPNIASSQNSPVLHAFGTLGFGLCKQITKKNYSCVPLKYGMISGRRRAW
jgi:hypothetical protein